MLKQEYRQVLETLYETTKGNRETYNAFISLIPSLTDSLLVQKISFYIHEMIEMPENPSAEMGVKLTLHAERASLARSDLEEYLLLKIKEQPISWQEIAKRNGWGPYTDLEKENEELRRLLALSEDMRRKYTKGKQDLYALGGDVAKAAFKLLPIGDRQLDNSVLTK